MYFDYTEVDNQNEILFNLICLLGGIPNLNLGCSEGLRFEKYSAFGSARVISMHEIYFL